LIDKGETMAKKNPVKQETYSAACVNCGVLIKKGEELLRDGKYTCEKCAVIPPAKQLYFLPPAGILRVLSYIVCVLSPAAGFMLGAVNMAQKEKDNSDFAKKCFIFSGAGLVLVVILAVAGTLLDLAAGSRNEGFKMKQNFYFDEGYY
jgi:hypothetical protein